MTKVTLQEASEIRPHVFTAEASTLGFAPGQWPGQLETDLGNGQPFVRYQTTFEVGIYRQLLGCIELRVFND